MVAPINPTNLTPPRVEFLDPRTGAISREWYRFFLSLLTATQTNQAETELAPDVSSTAASLQSELDTLAQSLETAPAPQVRSHARRETAARYVPSARFTRMANLLRSRSEQPRT